MLPASTAPRKGPMARQLPHWPSALAMPIAILSFILVLSACGVAAPETGRSQSAPTSESTLVALPVSPYADGKTICAGVGLPGSVVLTFEAGQIVAMGSGSSISIRWPPGYHAVFNPSFAEVDTDTGQVFATAGTVINPGPDNIFNGHVLCYDGMVDIWRLSLSSPT
jgi:hypothetical protein